MVKEFIYKKERVASYVALIISITLIFNSTVLVYPQATHNGNNNPEVSSLIEEETPQENSAEDKQEEVEEPIAEEKIEEEAPQEEVEDPIIEEEEIEEVEEEPIEVEEEIEEKEEVATPQEESVEENEPADKEEQIEEEVETPQEEVEEPIEVEVEETEDRIEEARIEEPEALVEEIEEFSYGDFSGDIGPERIFLTILPSPNSAHYTLTARKDDDPIFRGLIDRIGTFVFSIEVDRGYSFVNWNIIDNNGLMDCSEGDNTQSTCTVIDPMAGPLVVGVTVNYAPVLTPLTNLEYNNGDDVTITTISLTPTTPVTVILEEEDPSYDGVISYSTDTGDVCEIDSIDGTLTPRAVGDCNVTVTASENSIWLSNSITTVVSIIKDNTLPLAPVYPSTVYATDGIVSPTGGSYVPSEEYSEDVIHSTSSDISICSVDGYYGDITVNGSGTCHITVTAPETDKYLGGEVSVSVDIIKSETEASFTYSETNYLPLTTEITTTLNLTEGRETRAYDFVSDERIINFTEFTHLVEGITCTFNSGIVTITGELPIEETNVCETSVTIDENNKLTATSASLIVSVNKKEIVITTPEYPSPLLTAVGSILPTTPASVNSEGYGGVIEYSTSSTNSVCEIDSVTGEVTLNGAGVCDISVSASETHNHTGNQVSTFINIIKSETTINFSYSEPNYLSDRTEITVILNITEGDETRVHDFSNEERTVIFGDVKSLTPETTCSFNAGLVTLIGELPVEETNVCEIDVAIDGNRLLTSTISTATISTEKKETNLTAPEYPESALVTDRIIVPTTPASIDSDGYSGIITHSTTSDSSICEVDSLTGDITVNGPGTCDIQVVAPEVFNHKGSESSTSINLHKKETTVEFTYSEPGYLLNATEIDITINITEGDETRVYDFSNEERNVEFSDITSLIEGTTCGFNEGHIIVTGELPVDGSTICEIEVTIGETDIFTGAIAIASITIPKKEALVTAPEYPATVFVTNTTLEPTTEASVESLAYSGTIEYSTTTDSSICSVDETSGEITIDGIGTCDITATSSTTFNHTGAEATTSVEILKGETLATFTYSRARYFSDRTEVTPILTIEENGKKRRYNRLNERRNVVFNEITSLIPGTVCSFDSGVVTITGELPEIRSSVCEIEVTIGETNTFTGATHTASILINKKTPSVGPPRYVFAVYSTVGTITPSKRAFVTSQGYDADFIYSSSSDASICEVDSVTGVITVNGGGTCHVTATAPATFNYRSFGAGTSINISKVNTSVRFALADPIYSENTTEIESTITIVEGGATREYDFINDVRDINVSEITSAVEGTTCALNSGTVTITGDLPDVESTVCSFVITINEAPKYRAVTKTLNVIAGKKGVEVVAPVYPPISLVTARNILPITAASTTTEGYQEAIVYSTTSDISICSVDSSTGEVTAHGSGECEIIATAPATFNYLGNEASTSITIGKIETTASFINLATKYLPFSIEITPTLTLTEGNETREYDFVNDSRIVAFGEFTTLVAGITCEFTDAHVIEIFGELPEEDTIVCETTVTVEGTNNFTEATIALPISASKAETSITAPVYPSQVPATSGTINPTEPASVTSEGYGGLIIYSTSTTPVCSVGLFSGAVTIKRPGTCEISADALATSNYKGNQVSTSIDIIQAETTVTFTHTTPRYLTEVTEVPTVLSIVEGGATREYDFLNDQRTVVFGEIVSLIEGLTCEFNSGIVTITGELPDEQTSVCELGVTVDQTDQYVSATATLDVSIAKKETTLATPDYPSTVLATAGSVTLLTSTSIDSEEYEGIIIYSTTSSNCSVNPFTGEVTINGAGTCEITATATATHNHKGGTSTASISSNKAETTLTSTYSTPAYFSDKTEVTAILNITEGDETRVYDFSTDERTINVGTITSIFDTDTTCTFDSGVITILRGLPKVDSVVCEIELLVEGTDKLTASTETLSISVTKKETEITPAVYPESGPSTIGTISPIEHATVNSDVYTESIVYVSASTNSICTVNDTTGDVTVNGPGTCEIISTAPATFNHQGISTSSFITIDKLDTTLTFDYSVPTYFSDRTEVTPTLNITEYTTLRTYDFSNDERILTIGNIQSNVSGTSCTINSGVVTIVGDLTETGPVCEIEVTLEGTDILESITETLIITANKKASSITTLEYTSPVFAVAGTVTPTTSPSVVSEGYSGVIEYSTLSSTSICEVNSVTGEVDLIGSGTCEVTATAPATFNHLSSSTTAQIEIQKTSASLQLTYSTPTYNTNTTEVTPTLTLTESTPGQLSISRIYDFSTTENTVSVRDIRYNILGTTCAFDSGVVVITGNLTETGPVCEIDITIPATSKLEAQDATLVITANKKEATLTAPIYATPLLSTSKVVIPLQSFVTSLGYTGTIQYSTTSDNSICSVDSLTGALTTIGSGTCEITATAPATFNHTEGSVSASVSILKAETTATLSYPLTHRLGVSTTTPELTIVEGGISRVFNSLENRTITFTEKEGSDLNNYCSVNESTGLVTIDANVLNSVTCIVEVSIAENNAYTSASDVFTITTSTPHYEGVYTWEGSVFDVTLQNKVLPEGTTYSSTGQCTVDELGDVTITGAGVCTIDISTDETNLIINTQKGVITTVDPIYPESTIIDGSSIEQTNASLVGVTTQGYEGLIDYITETSNICSVDINTGELTPIAIGTCTVTTRFNEDINWASKILRQNIELLGGVSDVEFSYPSIFHPEGTSTVEPNIIINGIDISESTRTVTFTKVAGTDPHNYCELNPTTGVITLSGLITELDATCEIEISLETGGRYSASTHQGVLNISGFNLDFSGDGVINVDDSILFYGYALYTSIGFSQRNIEDVLETILKREVDITQPGSPRLSDSKEDVYALLDNYAKTNATDFSGDGVTNTTDSILFNAYSTYLNLGFSRSSIEDILEMPLGRELDYFSPGTPRLSHSAEYVYNWFEEHIETHQAVHAQ